jgi:succinate dehydrogenase / fumarate reductase iron-sulfur subunit
VVVPRDVVWSRSPRPPEAAALGPDGRLPVTELTVDRAGAPSPYGDDQQFPLPASEVTYQHPSNPS